MPTTTPVDLSDSALWQNGFPDDLFAQWRRELPIFHHELTEGVAQTVKRDFWMTTKHITRSASTGIPTRSPRRTVPSFRASGRSGRFRTSSPWIRPCSPSVGG